MNYTKRGDCVELFKEIPDSSVDLILTDPPYGVLKAQGTSAASKDIGYKTCEWDEQIDPAIIFQEAERILRPNGRLILFSSEPYSSRLINSATYNVQYNYKAYWVKNSAGNILGAGKAMTFLAEEILIFTRMRKYDVEDMPNPLREYFRDVLHFIGLNSAKEVNQALGHRKAEHAFYVTEGKQAVRDSIGGRADHTCRVGSSQWSLCTAETYQELVDKFHIDQMPGFRTYEDIRDTNARHLEKMNHKYGTTFNLWEGGKQKPNVLNYKKPGDGFHPTQKPVPLLEDLIKTFTYEGDTVMDFTMGSGSTWVAAIRTGRDFIGFEKEEGYYSIAEKRADEEMDRILEEADI